MFFWIFFEGVCVCRSDVGRKTSVLEKPSKTSTGARKSRFTLFDAIEKIDRNSFAEALENTFFEDRSATCSPNAPERVRDAFRTLPGSILEGVKGLPAPLGRLLGVSWALLGASWAPLGRSWAPLGWSWAPLGCILALRDVPDLDFGASGTNFEGPGASILEDLASILNKRFHSIPIHAHLSSKFQSLSLRSPSGLGGIREA